MNDMAAIDITFCFVTFSKFSDIGSIFKIIKIMQKSNRLVVLETFCVYTCTEIPTLAVDGIARRPKDTNTGTNVRVSGSDVSYVKD